MATVETVDVEDKAQDGKVTSQSPDAGLSHDFGAAVTIHVGVFVDPGEGEPPEAP